MNIHLCHTFYISTSCVNTECLVKFTRKIDTLLSIHYRLEYEGGRFFFNLVNTGDVVTFACDEDVDRLNWIHKLYLATGQVHKPVLNRLGNVPVSDNLQKHKGGEK